MKTATIDYNHISHVESKVFKRSLLDILSSLKMISANCKPGYCHDFPWNRDSVMISDEITSGQFGSSLESQLQK